MFNRSHPFAGFSSRATWFLLALAAGVATSLPAQTTAIRSLETPVARIAAPAPELASSLPDAPGMSSSAEPAYSPDPSSPDPDSSPKAGLRAVRAWFSEKPISDSPIAPRYDKYIEPGQTVLPLTEHQKLYFGFRQLDSPYLFVSVIAAATYEQATNGSPNYGTDLGAYGQRLGAAVIRDASQNIFTDSLMAPLLHEDPRYFIMGDKHNAIERVAYAATRVLITRTNHGTDVPNFALLAGYAGAAGLEQAYYPSDNQGFSETAKAFGGSLGGAAISNILREFLPSILHASHL